MGVIAQRYAKALVESGKEKNILPQLRKEFKSFLDLLRHDRDLYFIFMSPIFPDYNEKKALHRVLEKNVSPTFMHFIDVVISHGRETHIQDIYREFEDLADKAEAKVRVLLTTAFPIDGKQEENLNKKLSLKLGKDIVIDKQVDSSIIGGGIMKIGDKVFDSSIIFQLNSLRKELAAC